MTERVYYNLHKKCWSVQGADRRVRAHWPAACILDVTFKVSAAGRARVLREGRKNVHAFACGARAAEGVEFAQDEVAQAPPPGIRVTYNPRKAGFFYVAEGTLAGVEVIGAEIAWLGSDRTVRVIGPKFGTRDAFAQEVEA